MNSIAIIKDIVSQYEDTMLIRQNGTMLLEPGTWPEKPKARHIVLYKLSDEQIKEHIVNPYKYKIPEQYVEFLRYANGIALFSIKLHTKKHQLAQNMLEIYGLPLAPTFDRSRGEEPHDVRVEDLRKAEGIPKQYLKCGHYAVWQDDTYLYRSGIFIDTDTGRAFGIPDDKAETEREWINLDACISDLVKNLQDCPYDLNCI